MNNRTHRDRRPATRNLAVTVAEALITAVAGAAVMLAGLPLWVMFIGWISYYTRGVTPRDGVLNFLGVLIGLLIGLGAGSVLAWLGPQPTLMARISVILGVALIVLSLRFLPNANNLLAVFLGLVTFFAAHAAPNLMALLPLVAAGAVGSMAGAIAHAAQLRLQPEQRPAPNPIAGAMP